MDHSLVTLSVALGCIAGGVALYIRYLVPAMASLRFAEAALDAEKLKLSGPNWAIWEAPRENGPKRSRDSQANKDTETYNLIEKLMQQGRSGVVQIDIDGALEDCRSRLGGLVVWPRFYAQTAVYIGLLGTIIGLWLALANLQGATQIHDESTLREFATSTRTLLGSLQGAFMSALAGVLVTSVLGWRIQDYDRATDRYVDRLDEFARNQLLPKLEGLRLELLPESGLEAAKLIVSKLDGALQLFTNEWKDRFGSLSEATLVLAEANSHLNDAARSLQSSACELRQVMSALDSRLESLTTATFEIAGASVKSNEAVSNASVAVTELAKRAEQWPDLNLQLEKVSNQMVASTDLMVTSAQQLAATTTGFGEVWAGLNSHVRQLSQESFENLTRALLSALEDIVQKTGAEVASVVAGVHDRDAELSNLANRIGQAVDRQGLYSQQISDSVFKMYSMIPPLEDTRPSLEVMLTSLRTMSNALRDEAAQRINAETLREPPSSPVDQKKDPSDLRLSIEGVSRELRNSQGKADITNAKLDRIASLLEQLDSHKSDSHDIEGELASRRKGWWRRGR